jgi:CubicO group peptidase (beta-lactamase class C family)
MACEKMMKNWVIRLMMLCLSTVVLVSGTAAQAAAYEAAAAYSRERGGDAVLVVIDGDIAFEEYQNGYQPTQFHAISSGSKSFMCALAVLAQMDGLLTLDEPAADTLTEWKDDPVRSQITLRQILSQTDGLLGGMLMLHGRGVTDRAAAAIGMNAFSAPGERFHYGPSHFYLFNEVLRRKLMGGDTVDYLRERVLDRIGVANFEITRDAAGNPNWAAGVATTARSWARYGLLMLNEGQWNGETLLDADLLRECFVGTFANPYYGLTWWLFYDNMPDINLEMMAVTAPEPGLIPEGVVLGETAPAAVVAAGAGKQRMIIVPRYNMVVVRLGSRDTDWDDREFMALLAEAAAP